MIPIDEIPILTLILIGAGAGFVQRVSGFGLGIFAMLFLPYLMPSNAAAAVACLFSCCTSSYNAAKYRKNIRFRVLLPLLCAAFVMVPIAVRISASVPERQMKMLLGAALILLSIYLLFFSQRVHIRQTVPNGLIFGGLGGVLSGLFATGGPPIVLYLVHALEDKLVYFATIQFYFAVNNIYTTTIRAINGIITGQVLIYAAVGLIGCMVGDRIGARVFDRLDGQKVKRVIYLGMIISGVLMIL